MKRFLLLLFCLLFILHTGDALARKRRAPSPSHNWGSVEAPLNDEMCFSPDEPCAEKLVKFIESATHSLDIAIYDINEEQIVHAILLQTKKVPVRLVVDRKQAKGNHSAVSLLKQAGVNLRYGSQRGIFHNKFTLVDGTRVQTGSFNYTHHASTANHENQLYLATPSIVSRYQKHFEKVWREAKER